MAMKRSPSHYEFIKKNEFFKMLAEKWGFIDQQSTKDYYYSLIRLMCNELKKKGMVRLPDFGDFYLVFHKQRRSLNVNSRLFEFLPPKKAIKYDSDYKLKKYFNI